MNRRLSLFAVLLGIGTFMHGQGAGNQLSSLPGSEARTMNGALHISFPEERRPALSELSSLLTQRFGAQAKDEIRQVGMDHDALGYRHYRFQQIHEGYPVFGAVQKAHVQDGKIVSLSGHFVSELSSPKVNVTAEDALAKAIAASGAKKLIGELPGQDAYLQTVTGKPNVTWQPKGELIYALNRSDLPGTHRLAWKFDIYSVEPLFRADIYIDAETGTPIWRNERLHCADANGIGFTKFSGQRAIVTDDSAGTYYRLREAGRARGVETYDMQNQTDYNAAVDVIQSDNVWDTFPDMTKRAALDAHWGAEMTYDYFKQHFNRESYDDDSSKLVSFVHFDNGYSNAFWNGQFMTYGDGAQNNQPFPGLDVCGHEFTHGVTEYAAGLIYQDEPGALNESFSDIFGNSIEFWSRPNDASWYIGDDIGAFRNMGNPNAFFNPDTYQGNYWSPPGGFDNGGVHSNSGVQNYWYYLLAQGGSGTNDNGDYYQVNGLGLDTAAQIAYRCLQVYLSPTDGHAEARYFGIQSAIDLYGECSNAMIQTMNAWYAVGVGVPYTGTLTANFHTQDTNLCHIPSDVQFSNQSTSSLNYLWDFGDGNTSTATNPSHVYNAAGTYTVTLIAYGCNGTSDTLIFVDRIRVDPLLPCNVNMPGDGGTVTETGCEGFLYDSGGSDDYLNSSHSRLTIDPAGNQQVMLVFQSFDYAPGDRISVYDGLTTTAPLIGVYSGNALPPAITSTSSALTLLESTNGASTRAGFEASWSCVTATSDAFGASDCEVYPNPTEGLVSLRWPRGKQETHAVQVLDGLGRIVLAQNGSHADLWSATIDLSTFPAGMYTLHLKAGEDQVIRKIIVQ